MEKRRRLVLYGRSLFLAGIAASFRGRSDLDVLLLDSTLPDAPGQVSAMRPDAVVFDRSSIDPAFVVSFLQEHPGVRLLGLDMASDKLTAFSSEQSVLGSMDDLVHIIHKELDSSAAAT